MLPLPDTGTELSAPGEGAGEGGEREGGFVIDDFDDVAYPLMELG